MLNKLLIFLLVIVSCIENVPAQVIGNFSYDYWYVAPNVLLKRDNYKVFKMDSPVLGNLKNPNIPVSGESSSNVYNLISKNFYFMNRNNFYMNEKLISDKLINAGTSNQGLLILPDNWQNNRVYIFSHYGFYSDLYYSIYNLETLLFEKFNVSIVQNATERLHSIFVDNSFRIATTDKEGHLVTIILDSLGLHQPKFHAKVKTNQNYFAGMGEMKFSNKGNLIAVVYNWDPNTLFLYKYDVIQDEACLMKVINDGLSKDAFYVEFDLNDSCILTHNGNWNRPLVSFDISNLNSIVTNVIERKENGASQFISIPFIGTYNLTFGSKLLNIEYLNNCGQVSKTESYPIDLNYLSTVNVPNIPKVIDSIYAPPDYPCLNPEDIEYTYREYEDIFKNVLTPNNDGFNDFFTIEWPDFWKFSYYKVTILNRYGQTIYASNDLKFSWDGKRNGRTVPDGAYYYVIEFNEKILGQKVFTGAINVMD